MDSWGCPGWLAWNCRDALKVLGCWKHFHLKMSMAEGPCPGPHSQKKRNECFGTKFLDVFFVEWKKWRSDLNWFEFDWPHRGTVSDCLSQLRVHIAERVQKYNQQQRQIKHALPCKSISMYWLHTVIKTRKEASCRPEQSACFLCFYCREWGSEITISF